MLSDEDETKENLKKLKEEELEEKRKTYNEESLKELLREREKEDQKYDKTVKDFKEEMQVIKDENVDKPLKYEDEK